MIRGCRGWYSKCKARSFQPSRCSRAESWVKGESLTEARLVHRLVGQFKTGTCSVEDSHICFFHRDVARHIEGIRQPQLLRCCEGRPRQDGLNNRLGGCIAVCAGREREKAACDSI